MTSKPSRFASALVEWYDRHARSLPWRMPPDRSRAGERPVPYHVWLSEIMLQQTQVATVRDYYLDFLDRWPTVLSLAEAATDDVMKAWAGLGYYSRARNLKKCADVVANDFSGHFPQSTGELRQLPGIGEYTSAAIAAIAFGERVAVVDGNVERIVARQLRLETPLPAAKAEIRDWVSDHVPADRPGDFAQAMMDLGATLCSPRKPACALCPVAFSCAAGQAGDAETYPRKLPKADKPRRKGAAFVIRNADGDVYLERRPANGLLGGMSALPGTAWTARQDGTTGEACLPFPARWRMAGIARHTFTHFHLELEVWETNGAAPSYHGGEGGWFASLQELPGEALPTVMKKAIETAIPGTFKKNTPGKDEQAGNNS